MKIIDLNNVLFDKQKNDILYLLSILYFVFNITTIIKIIVKKYFASIFYVI